MKTLPFLAFLKTLRHSSPSLFRLLALPLACLTLVAATPARAVPLGLTLDIDPLAETFTLSGFDTGTFGNYGSYWAAQWWLQGLGGGEVGGYAATVVAANDLWTSSVGEPTDTGFYPASFSIQSDAQASGSVTITLFNTLEGPSDVEGLGVTTSYAGMSAPNKAQFESLIGTSIPLGYGDGFSSINAVPEPGSALLLGVGALGLLAARRRRGAAR